MYHEKSGKCEKSKRNEIGNRGEKIFWNLFLETGRIDAYLLLKEEESIPAGEKEP